MTIPPDDARTNGPIRRIEVFTGAGHRRRWTKADKVRIVAESYGGHESASAVARRYGLAQTQLFAWRRELRDLIQPQAAEEPAFVPVLVEAASAREGSPPLLEPPRPARRHRERGGIELEIGGVSVRVGAGAETRAITAVIRALKAGS
jgi:transposase